MFKKIANYFSGIASEFKKVIWPTPKQLAKNTWAVFVIVILIGVAIWVLDYAFGLGVKGLISI